ncbi:MAG: hypothetical protein P4L40_26740 [Terracidiphilus sp.]|nr:hypothetical protein [Terracidiphilus sp.]
MSSAPPPSPLSSLAHPFSSSSHSRRPAMVASALYILDLKGKIIISRDYRGDVSKGAVEKCVCSLSLDC